MSTEEIGATARVVIDQLTSLQTAMAGRPDGERRQAIEQTIRERLSSLAAPAQQQVLARCRDLLIDRAKDRDQRARSAETELARVRPMVDALRVECDRMTTENAKLKELMSVRGAGSGFEGLAIRLKNLGDAPQPDLAGLAESEAHIVATIHELFRFAFMLGRKLMEFEAEQRGEGSIIVRDYEKRFKRLFIDSIDGKEGQSDKLRQLLGEMVAFLGRVDRAWTKAVPDGARAMLDEIKLEEIKSKHKQFGGTNWEKVVASIEKQVEQLRAMDLADYFRRHFGEKFVKERADAP